MILSGRTKSRAGWIAGVLLLLVATAILPLAAVAQAESKDAATPLAEPIKTELKLKNTRFRADAPIMVDVWVENQTEQDIERKQFSPISSSVGLPDFEIVRVPDGKEFSIPPGLFGDDWDQWYQPVSGKKAFSVGGFSLPSRKRIHLLHGDLRLTVVRARERCQRALDEDSTLKRPDNASTKKHYQEIVRSADDFLSGGTFDIRVRAYSRSQTIRITVDKKDRKKKQMTSWGNTRCAVFCEGEQTPSMVHAKKAVYDVEAREGGFTTVPVTAFVTPETGRIWMGPEQEYYIETDAGIVGFHMRLGGTVFWCKSLAKEPTGTAKTQGKKDDPSREFDREVSGSSLFDAQIGADRETRRKRKTHLDQKISHWFFDEGVASSQSGLARILRAEISGGLLKLDLANPTGEYEASVWIDIDSRKATKADEDKDQYRSLRK